MWTQSILQTLPPLLSFPSSSSSSHGSRTLQSWDVGGEEEEEEEEKGEEEEEEEGEEEE